jgi:hypothetical protein
VILTGFARAIHTILIAYRCSTHLWVFPLGFALLPSRQFLSLFAHLFWGNTPMPPPEIQLSSIENPPEAQNETRLQEIQHHDIENLQDPPSPVLSSSTSTGSVLSHHETSQSERQVEQRPPSPVLSSRFSTVVFCVISYIFIRMWDQLM